MSRVIQTTDADGKTSTKTNSYTELATGLHYLKDGKLVESKAEIALLPQGGAAATQGQHQVYFPANLNGGVIDLVMPDGRELKSQVRGLGYYDKATGKNVILAEVRDTEGTLYPPNVIVYENAFNGVNADVRYTYRRSGFEQDVILREQFPTPKQLGLGSETTRLEVITEFIDSPTPDKQTVGVESQAITADQLLRFGSMTIVRGRAFSIGEPGRTNRPVAVSKSWEQIDGRSFLIEQVDYNQIAPKIGTLPKPPRGASLYKPGTQSKIGKLASIRQLPARNVAAIKSKPVNLARAKETNRPGFLLDWPIQIVSENNFTLAKGQTYYVVGDGPGGAILTGTTTIESGAVIKSRFDDPYQGIDQYVLLLDDLITHQTCNLVCDTTPDNPAVFTDWCDDSVGETIEGSYGYPNGTYPWALATFGGGTAIWQYKNLKFMHGQPAIFVGDTTSTIFVSFQNCQFLGITVDGIVAQLADSGSVLVRNGLFALDGTAVSVVGANTFFSAQNVTADRFVTFESGAGTVDIKDSLFIGGGQVPGTPTFTSFATSGSGLFQTGALGTYYLNIGNTWVAQNLIDQGSQNVNSSSLVGFTTRIDQTPDTGQLDRGFHYIGLPQLTTACRPHSIVLNWTLPEWLLFLQPQGYNIYRCSTTSSGCNPTVLYASSSSPSTLTFVDTAVTPGVNYCYRVSVNYIANGQTQESPLSNTSCSSTCCPSGGNHLWVDTGASAQQMAEWIMAGSGISVVPNSAAFSGDTKPWAKGTYGNGAAAGLPSDMDKGVILSTGDARIAEQSNNKSDAGKDNGIGNGDPDLDALFNQVVETHDPAVLTFDITSSSATTLSFKYMFASEEYPEWLGQKFNDLCGIFIHTGNNTPVDIARLPNATQSPVGVDFVSGGFNGSGVPAINPEFYQDNHDPNNSSLPQYAVSSPVYSFQYDGAVIVRPNSGPNLPLTAQTSISVGTTYHIKIAIEDAGDGILDSVILIKAQIPCP